MCHWLPQGAAAILLAVVVFGESALAGPEGATGSSYDYRTILRCGPNSLYTFLILSGHPEVTFEQCDHLPVSPQGTPLSAICDAARQFQIDGEIRRYDVSDIDSLPLPAIGQFTIGESNKLSKYHFSVIYKVDTGRVYIIDGTVGALRYVRRSALGNFWTGVAMSRRPTRTLLGAEGWLALALTVGVLAADAVAVASFGNWLVSVWRKRRTVDNPPEVGR